jgi:hypothetical protein
MDATLRGGTRIIVRLATGSVRGANLVRRVGSNLAGLAEVSRQNRRGILAIEK